APRGRCVVLAIPGARPPKFSHHRATWARVGATEPDAPDALGKSSLTCRMRPAQVSRAPAIQLEALRPPPRLHTRSPASGPFRRARVSTRLCVVNQSAQRLFLREKRILGAVSACPFWRPHF